MWLVSRRTLNFSSLERSSSGPTYSRELIKGNVQNSTRDVFTTASDIADYLAFGSGF